MRLQDPVPMFDQQGATQHKEENVLPPGIINSFMILENSYNPAAPSSL